MKHIVIACLTVALVAALCYSGDLVTSGNNTPIQGFGGNEKKDVVITGKSQNINITQNTCWQVYTPTAGIFRTMTSATKVGIAHTLPAGAWYGEVVNGYASKNRFLNISGASDYRGQ
jgi:hypothetical protein